MISAIRLASLLATDCKSSAESKVFISSGIGIGSSSLWGPIAALPKQQTCTSPSDRNRWSWWDRNCSQSGTPWALQKAWQYLYCSTCWKVLWCMVCSKSVEPSLYPDHQLHAKVMEELVGNTGGDRPSRLWAGEPAAEQSKNCLGHCGSSFAWPQTQTY